MCSNKSRIAVLPLLFAINCLGSTSVLAAVLEEIVVTAQKITQDVQKVPIAISTFTADTLQTKDLTSLSRLTSLTPNVNLEGGAPFSGDSSVLSASIRGIGQDDFAINLDPGVGVYLDGVFLARTIGANQNLLGIDRIEVLKGPQGTLFGRNTIGGAISLITHTPGDEFKVTGQATLGSYNRQDVQVKMDLPITQNILSTVSVSSQKRDGWQDVVPYPADSSIGQNAYQVMGQADMPKAPGTHTSSHNGGQNIQAMRGKILFHATPHLDMTLTGDYTYQDQSGLPNTISGVVTANQDHYIDPNGPGAGELFGRASLGNFYNMCVSTPASALVAGPFNATNGLCGPLGVGTWNSIVGAFRGNGFTGGVPALGGTGAVGVPNAVLQGIVSTYGGTLQPNGSYLLPGGGVVTLGKDRFGGSVIYPGKTPRLYWDMQNTQAPGKDTTYSNGPSFARYNAWGASMTLDWDIRDNMQLKSITGWRGIKWDIGTDLDGTPESIQEVTDEQKQWQFSQELQLTGRAFDNRLNYVTGLYFFTEKGYVHDFVPFDTAYLWIYDYRNNVHTDSYAAYMHLDYQVTSKVGLTFGARYSIENKDFTGGQGDLNGLSYKFSGCLDPKADANTFPGFGAVPAGINCQQALGFPDSNNPLRYFPPGKDHHSWDIFTPMGGAQYHFNDNLMAYFSYSEGFRSGGWTTRLSAPLLEAADARFGPEYDTTYEVGVKSQWFENRVRANIAGFYSQYDGIVINVQKGPSPVYQNAGDARIKGVELETQSVLDNGFSLAVNAGYMDVYYSRLEPCLKYLDTNMDGVCTAAEGSVLNPNFALLKTPKYKINVNPSYEFNLANGSNVLFTMDYTHTEPLRNAVTRRPATDMLNASAHWTPVSGKYELAAGVTNLTDDRYLITGSANPAAGEIVGSYNAPRMWYVSARVNFQ